MKSPQLYKIILPSGLPWKHLICGINFPTNSSALSRANLPRSLRYPPELVQIPMKSLECEKNVTSVTQNASDGVEAVLRDTSVPIHRDDHTERWVMMMRRLLGLRKQLGTLVTIGLLVAWPVWADAKESSFPGVEETIFTIERPEPV